ncbi:MAG: AAA family ATPase, partial [Solirubrobacteraceae bacterium]
MSDVGHGRRAQVGARADANTGRLNPYVPRVLLERLATVPEAAVLTEDATVVFIDISGFTKLSERLARAGREGAEHLVDTISACFSTLLAEAYADGGSLLKFGGDALLLWFTGEEHALRACSCAVGMRRTLRQIGRVRAGGSSVVLRMSVGIHSGAYETFLVGDSHREYLPAGPAVSAVVALESHAEAGQILISADTATRLPDRCLGASSGPGVLLARAPMFAPWLLREAAAPPPDATVASCLSTALRAHLLAAPAHPEHRTATVSFLQFGELDSLIAERGAIAAADAVEEVVRSAQRAADRYETCILGSDIAADGGKLLFSAGAPRAIGDEEERILLTLRQILDAQTQLPVRAGVTRGYVFTGEVGPPFRRTFAVMGDVVNLAARLAARAPWRSIYTIDPVLARTHGRFATTAVAPFVVKGKSRPIEAFTVDAPLRAAPQEAAAEQTPLIGRDRELAAVAQAVAAAHDGHGSLVELRGETGSGTSRLLAEVLRRNEGTRTITTTCDSYSQAIPYIAWRELLRQLLGLGWDDPDDAVLAHLRTRIDAVDPQLAPWLPLIAIAHGVDATPTREVDELARDARTARLHEAVLDVIAGELSTPTVVVVEHLDLIDEASAGLLGALAERLERSSWLVIATRRDANRGFTSDSGSIVRVDLGPLARDDAVVLAESTPAAHRLPPHMLALAVDRAGGNPEFLLDLLAAATTGSGELPDTIEAAASARIDALDPGDRALVRRAAVLGLTFRAARLRHVLEPDGALPTAATWKRLSQSLERDADGYVRFTSPILVEVAYAGLPFALRRTLHRAVGDALERDLGTDVDADPAVLSLHFSRAGDHERAWRYAVMSAERAAAHFAVADAARLYRRAIEAHRGSAAGAGELAPTWEALGNALSSIGEIPEAEHAFATAQRLSAGDAVALARICFRRGQIAERTELSRAVRWMRRGLRTLEGAAGDEARSWRARLIADLAWIRQRQLRYREAERLCRDALAESAAIGELRAEARAAYTLDWALFELGRPEEATHSPRALEIYRELGDPEQEGRVLNNLGGLAYWRGRWQEAIDLYRQAGACSERAGHSADLAFTDANVGEILADQGLLEEGEAYLRRALRVWTATSDRQGCAFATMLLGRLAVRAGRAADGIAQLDAAVADMQRFGVDFYAEFAAALIVEGEALGGDAVRAVALADDKLASG